MISKIDKIFSELDEQRKTSARKPISYYSGVRLDLSECISFLLENRDQLGAGVFNKYIHRCNMLMELAESLKRDVTYRLYNMEQVVRELSIERDGGEFWREVLKRVRAIKKENVK